MIFVVGKLSSADVFIERFGTSSRFCVFTVIDVFFAVVRFSSKNSLPHGIVFTLVVNSGSVPLERWLAGLVIYRSQALLHVCKQRVGVTSSAKWRMTGP